MGLTMTSTVPPGRGRSASLPRHFVPGYCQPVPPGQEPFAGTKKTGFQMSKLQGANGYQVQRWPRCLPALGRKPLTLKTQDLCQDIYLERFFQ
jgi:hypothetical protein